MRRSHRVLLPSLLLSLVTGCSASNAALIRRMVPAAEDQYAQSRIQALARGDTGVILREVDPQLRTPAAIAQIASMAGLLKGRTIRSMELIGYQGMSTPGGESRNITYQLRLSDGWAAANVASRTVGGAHVIQGASVMPLKEPLQETHRFRLAGKSPLHYVVLALMVLLPLLMLYAFVVAWRFPVKRRWPWLLASVVGLGQLSLNWTTGEYGVRPINVQLLGAGMLRPSIYSPWLLSISLPIGALVVLWRARRGFAAAAQVEEPPPAEVDTPPSTPTPLGGDAQPEAL
ncbi:MAG: hypothetical protein JWM27_1324 [Gemmatimonadetes bacterium]|nr:hypothetical protein [Gemmatimonadota bacterium]